VLADHGTVDILINNAGRSIRRSVRHSYDRFHDFERTMDLNYFGALRLILGFLPGMEAQEHGHIINISSIGVLASPPRFSAYVASKAALDAFSHCAAPEYAAQNIIFTTIHMPLVRTPMIAPTSLYKAFPTLSPEQARDLVIKAIISRPKRVSTQARRHRCRGPGHAAERDRGLPQPGLCPVPGFRGGPRPVSEEEAAKEREELPQTKLELAQKTVRAGHARRALVTPGVGRVLLPLLALLLAACSERVTLPPGVMAPEPPRQGSVEPGALTPTARTSTTPRPSPPSTSRR
jgi:hypothetical protein